MTQSSSTAPSVHTKPAVAAGIGVAAGILTLVQAYFGSGHIPSSAEVASVFAGSGLTLGSIATFVLHHLGITKVEASNAVTIAEAEYAKLEPLVGTVPGLQARIDDIEKNVDQRVHDLVASLPAPVQVDVDQIAAQVQAKMAAALGTPAPAAPAVPPADPTVTA